MNLESPLIGWFHLSSEETSRARDFLRRCNGEDAVDELGFGILRDGFSEQFYPGTSTVMTQPRYLLFIPAIYCSIERALQHRRGSTEDILRRGRKMQNQLRDQLAATYGHKRGNGVIGISVSEPERYPSVIYWAALRTLGIFRRPGMTEDDYFRSLKNPYETRRNDSESDDPVAEIAAPVPAWDSNFPYFEKGEPVQDASGRFVTGIRFELPPEEAKYLAGCYLRPDTKDESGAGLEHSLLASLIRRRRMTKFEFPWDVAAPPHLVQPIDDAKHFSLFARGATLQYYFLLIKERSRQGLPVPNVDIEAQFALWWNEGRPQLVEWSEDDFLVRRLRDVRPARNDATFLKNWLRRCRGARTARSFLSNEATQQLTVARERVCKPKKARLTHPKHLETWNRALPDSTSIYQLDFRTSIGATFVTQIVAGLGDANPARAGVP
jgi:uncharacterized protein DUF6361